MCFSFFGLPLKKCLCWLLIIWRVLWYCVVRGVLTHHAAWKEPKTLWVCRSVLRWIQLPSCGNFSASKFALFFTFTYKVQEIPMISNLLLLVVVTLLCGLRCGTFPSEGSILLSYSECELGWILVDPVLVKLPWGLFLVVVEAWVPSLLFTTISELSVVSSESKQRGEKCVLQNNNNFWLSISSCFWDRAVCLDWELLTSSEGRWIYSGLEG